MNNIKYAKAIYQIPVKTYKILLKKYDLYFNINDYIDTEWKYQPNVYIIHGTITKPSSFYLTINLVLMDSYDYE